MDDTNKDFANELIKKYGEDRFYHCCRRMLKDNYPVFIYLFLHEDQDSSYSDPNFVDNFFRSIGLPNCNSKCLLYGKIPIRNFTDSIGEVMCKIAYGFCLHYKEYGLKTYELPDYIHARMILGKKNEWVENYLKLLEKYKN